MIRSESLSFQAECGWVSSNTMTSPIFCQWCTGSAKRPSLATSGHHLSPSAQSREPDAPSGPHTRLAPDGGIIRPKWYASAPYMRPVVSDSAGQRGSDGRCGTSPPARARERAGEPSMGIDARARLEAGEASHTDAWHLLEQLGCLRAQLGTKHSQSREKKRERSTRDRKRCKEEEYSQPCSSRSCSCHPA